MSDSPRWVHPFDEALELDAPAAQRLLGGKGASLNAMTRAGLAVPPGFTIDTQACAAYYALGRRWPDGLETQVREHLTRLEQSTGLHLGRGPHPLLVSVRSGAASSMPGMMDTLLNCGLSPALAHDLAQPDDLWPRYLDFIRAFASAVHGLDAADLGLDTPGHHAPGQPRAQCLAALDRYQQRTGQPFPSDPWLALVACINAVFDSWQSDRAIAYRRRHQLTGLAGTAVNVQRMFPSQVSGIVFTRDPNPAPSASPATPGTPGPRESADLMIVEASYGLGESVVSGQVTPDRFLVRRTDLAAVESHPGHKAHQLRALGDNTPRDPDALSLSDAQLRELATLALRIEQHYGKPVDIEWGLADGQFAMLQARPIRGLDIAAEVDLALPQERQRLAQLAGASRHVWIIHNLAETLRFPTPLTWDIMRRFMTGDGGFGRLYQSLGYRPSPRVRQEGFLELIAGRIYADPRRLAQLFWDGMPLTYNLDALDAHAPAAALDHAPDTFDPHLADGRFLRSLPANLLGMFRASRRARLGRAQAATLFMDRTLPPYLCEVRRRRNLPLSDMADDQLLAELRSRLEFTLDQFAPQSLLPGFFGGIAFDQLKATLTRLMGPDEGPGLASTLVRGLDGDTTFEQDALLHDVAHGHASMDAFLDRFGHRALNEMELAEPRWREDRVYLDSLLHRLRAPAARNPRDIHHAAARQRLDAHQQLPDLLRRCGGSSCRESIEHDLADAQRLLPFRESGKHYLMMGYELIRLAIEELARRRDLGSAAYFLTLDELAAPSPPSDALLRTAEERQRRWRAWQRIETADVVDSARLDQLGQPSTAPGDGQLRGSAIASGVATGRARIVLDPAHAGDLGDDYVLVCPSTDPGWTPLFVSARALVVERGGVLSHGAIVARDFGIPAVVCPGATRLLTDGRLIRVDGRTGQITLLENAPAHA